jgi:Asp-tRNA(Asn)/Glu-tRNA(Gln) amidotransferase A subunit family amidase
MTLPEKDGITLQSASRLAELIRDRAVSPVAVVEAYQQRIEKLNPTLNAIVTLAPDLREKAKKAEAAVMSGNHPGALHGVPITIKDTIETAGLRTTSGSVRRAQFVPEQDAPAVARLKAAGAIILGKTNTAEMAMDYTADNPVFGRTNNPYDLSCTPGGSSGGEAAAITACLSPVGLGSDLAGSIRIPAHFCGIAGLKPTAGRVSSAGQFPPSIGPYSLGAAIGPMARCIQDLQLLFGVLVGSETPTNTPDHYRLGMRGWRVAWYANDDVVPVPEETRGAVEKAARALADAGLVVEECRPPGVERGFDLWLKLFSRASVVQLREVYSGYEKTAGPFVRWRLATADETPALALDEYISAWMERDRLRLALDHWMNAIPLLVAPVGATAAFKHETQKVTVAGQTFSTFRAFSYAQTFNVFDLPCVCLPAGRSAEGLPIGVQIIGRPFAEEAVLAAAAIVEEALGGWQSPPMSGKL